LIAVNDIKVLLKNGAQTTCKSRCFSKRPALSRIKAQRFAHAVEVNPAQLDIVLSFPPLHAKDVYFVICGKTLCHFVDTLLSPALHERIDNI
jgi:hypothetical protein